MVQVEVENSRNSLKYGEINRTSENVDFKCTFKGKWKQRYWVAHPASIEKRYHKKSECTNTLLCKSKCNRPNGCNWTTFSKQSSRNSRHWYQHPGASPRTPEVYRITVSGKSDAKRHLGNKTILLFSHFRNAEHALRLQSLWFSWHQIDITIVLIHAQDAGEDLPR